MTTMRSIRQFKTLKTLLLALIGSRKSTKNCLIVCQVYRPLIFRESLSPHGPQSSPHASSKSLTSHSACSLAWHKMHDSTPKSTSNRTSDFVCDANSSIVLNVPEFPTFPIFTGVWGFWFGLAAFDSVGFWLICCGPLL
jgi:hypothetical protein